MIELGASSCRDFLVVNEIDKREKKIEVNLTYIKFLNIYICIFGCI